MEKTRLGTGRVAFLAHLEIIRKEVEAGWTMQAVYDTHGPKLGITYSQFTRYVARFVKERPPRRLRQGEETLASSMGPTAKSFEVSETVERPKPHPLFEATPPPDQELF